MEHTSPRGSGPRVTFTRLLELHSNVTPLMIRAAQILDSLNLDELKREGFYRDSQTYSYVFQYPPSAVLHPILQSDVAGKLNSEVSANRKLGLYVHVPYCTGTCAYCYFARSPYKDAPIEITEYVDLLMRDIELSWGTYRLEHALVTSVAFGGGTPTCLEGEDTRRLLTRIHGTFNLAQDLEVSFEASPETTVGRHSSKLSVLHELGVNRISIGIQSFDDRLLRILHRRHTSEMAENSIASVREMGFENINIDLMYGLPTQNLTDWQQTLFKATDMHPASISLYRLRIHPGSPLAKLEQSEFPDEILNSLMYMMAVVHMTARGYIQAASHLFVTDEKYIQRHVTEKQGVEEYELVGIGVSSYSYLNKYFFWNTFSLPEYKERIDNGRLAVSIGTHLTMEERQRKVMVLGIHEYGGISRAKFRERFGRDPKEMFGKVLNKLTHLGLMNVDDASIYPTQKGLLFADEICTEFYSSAVKSAIQASGAHRYGINYIGKEFDG